MAKVNPLFTGNLALLPMETRQAIESHKAECLSRHYSKGTAPKPKATTRPLAKPEKKNSSRNMRYGYDSNNKSAEVKKILRNKGQSWAQNWLKGFESKEEANEWRVVFRKIIGQGERRSNGQG